MNKEYLEILTNIIGGVESGGQVYGNRRYDAYAGKGANADNEKTCTLGWAQNYGNEGRKLCKMILDADAAAFRKADTAEIEKKLNTDWEATGWDPSSKEKAALIAIITTDAGKKCQDELFEQLMTAYVKEAEAYGVSDVKAQMMWCEIEHLGGLGPVKRIFGRAAKPYTPDSIFTSLLLDQNDTSNDNQVGDKKFQSRHECCVRWIKQYVKEEGKESTEMTELEIRQKVVNTAIQYYGCKESDGSHKKIIDIYNGHKPLARGYKVQYTDAWCATYVSAIAILCDLTDIMFTECGCGAMIQLYSNAGRWQENDAYVPSPGDIIMYYWNDSGSGDCTGYPDHVGIVVSVSGNSIKVIEGNKSNAVGYRTISVNERYIRGYCLPNYASKASGSTSSSGSTGSNSTGSTSSGGLNKIVKWNGVVTADSLNVRTWAGTENGTCSFSPLKNAVEVGVCDSVTASDGSIWYYIKYNGKYGFVHSSYISKIVEADTSGTSNEKKVAYAKSKSTSLAGTYKVSASDGLNLRYEPGKLTDDNLILTIPNGGKVTCYGYYTAVDGVNWPLVAYGDKTGFVSSKYLKKQ